MDEKNTRWRKFWIEWLKPLLVIAIITTSFRSAVADWNDVPTGSMKPTILEGDRIFVNKLAYDLKVPFTTMHLASWDNPQRGDIVVLYSPFDNRRLVKRAVAIPGDVIELRNDLLLVNGKQAEYDSLPRKAIEFMPREEQSESVFYSEQIENRRHAIMLTPELPARRNLKRTVVPDGKYFVMGDNRDNSFDSRFFGFVERRMIVGRATAVVASLNPGHHYFPRWQRWFSALQ